MRALVFTSMFAHTRHEGRGKGILRRCVALSRRCEVKVIAPQLSGDLPRHEWLDGLEVYRPHWRHVPKVGILFDGYQHARLGARAAAELLTRYDFDLIDSHFLYPDGFGAMLLARRLGKPLVLNGRGTDVNEYCFRWPQRYFARRALRGATQLVAVSRPLKERMIAAGAPADRITVVHNGVETEVFHPADRSAARRELGLPEDEIVLFSAGALVEGKGFQHLLVGMSRAVGSRPMRLYIAGPGEGSWLRRMAEAHGMADRLALLGSLPQDELPRWYQAADFFCFGSLREGCPNVIIEALACGTPVLSTSVGAVPDLVEDERCGVLFEPGSAEAFATTLRDALSRTWDRAYVAERGSRRSWDHVADEVHTVFERALGRAGGA